MSPLFESLVSFEGCKTKLRLFQSKTEFESLVSFEGCKTVSLLSARKKRLRVL